MRSRTLTNSSSETPTCVTSLKRRSRRISQQMLALLSSHSAGKDEELKSGQTESQSWSPMASRGTLTTLGTTSGLHRPALETNNSRDILGHYTGNDTQHEPRSMGYPPQLQSGHRSRAPHQGHTPSSSYSSKSREPQKQSPTSPTKPSGPRAPNQAVSLRVTDSRSQRRPHGISTDALNNRRVQLPETDFSYTEHSPNSSSVAISLRNLGQPTSAPPTSRYESQQISRRNTRPAIVAPQDASPSLYPNSHPNSPVPPTPKSAPPYSTSLGGPTRPPRSKTTVDRGTATPGRKPAGTSQAPHHHTRAMSDGIAGGLGPHIEPRRTHAHAHGGTGTTSARPRSPRDGGIVGGGTTHRPEHAHARKASPQTSGSDYSESGQYATVDISNPHLQQQPALSAPVALASRDHQTSFDVDSRPVAAAFSLSPVPRSQQLQIDYFQPQQLPQQQQPTSTEPAWAESTPDVTAKAKAKVSWQGAPDLRGSIADLWTSAVNAAEEEHQLELFQKSNGPLSATSITSAGSSGVLTNESSSYPGSPPNLLSFGLSGRPGSRGGKEKQPQPQAPAIVHSTSGSSYSHSHHNHHVTVTTPPALASQAGPLPSPPRHIDVMPGYPPPPRPARAIGSISVAPPAPNPSASAHGSATSIPLERPLGSREPSPHKSHTLPSPARPPPLPVARPPSPPKSPPPLPPPAKSIPPSRPPVPGPHEASGQSPTKTPVSLPLSPASNSTNANNTKSLSIFARGSTSPIKAPTPLPPIITTKSAPAPAPAPSSPVKPPVPLPDPITKPRTLSPQPQPPVKPLQLRTKNDNNNNNSPLPLPPMQLPSVPAPASGKENTRENMNTNRENANQVVPPPRSRERQALSRADSDYSIVAVSIKSGSTEDDAADDEESEHGGVKVEVEVQGLQAVGKREEHVESSESEYSGSESHESKVTSSTVAVAPTPSAPKSQLGDKTTEESTGSLHVREAAESTFLVQMHRVINTPAEVTTPRKDMSVPEGLDATPTPGNPASRGKVKPPAPVPVPVPASSRRKENIARPDTVVAPYQSPPKPQLFEEPRVELRPISLGFIKDEDIMFHFSEAELIHTSDLTIEAPQPATYGRKDAKPTPRAASPKRSMSGRKPPVATKDVPSGGHARRRENMPSSGSEYEDNTHGHRSRLEEKRTPARSPDFGDPFATPDSSSRPTTANTTTTSSASAAGHASLLGWGAPPRKRNTRTDRGGFKRTTIVARFVDGSNLGHGVEGDVEDADEDEDEDDDEFEVETEHGRVLKKLVKEKSSWPSAMSFRDVLSEATTAARARGYATKLNELAKEDCGLGDWIEVWLKPKLFAGQLDIQPSGVSAHSRVASGASVFSETTFPMRVDAFRAIDLTPGAGGGPTELGHGPPPLPYPSLAMKQLQQGNVYNFKSNANSPNNLHPPKKSNGFFSSLGRKASMKSKAAGGDSSGQENREKERVRRKLYRAPPGSSTSQLGHFSDIGIASSRASLVPLAPSIVGGPRAPPGKPKRASTVLVIGPPQLIHPPPPAQYPPNPSKRSSLDPFISAATSSSSTVALHQPMSFQTNMVPPAPEGLRPVTRTPSFPGHSSSSSSINRGNGLTPPDANVKGGGGNGPERRSKLRQAVSYQPPRQPSEDGHFEKSLDKLCDYMPDLEREVLAGYLRQAGGQEMVAIGRIVDAQKRGTIARP